jgi:hypothetical protein
MFAEFDQTMWMTEAAQEVVDDIEQRTTEQWSAARRLQTTWGAMIGEVARQSDSRARLEHSLRRLPSLR